MRSQRDSSAGIIADELEAERDMIREVRRAAKLEVLREVYDRMCGEPHTVLALNNINDMIASLESEAAEPAKEET